MPELDSLRGIAILAVLFYHGLFWQIDLSHFSNPTRLLLQAMWMGRLGVNLFFVLSGFLITGLLSDSKERDDYYFRFYVRRALRIVPAYLAVMVALVALAYAPWKFVVLSLLYLSNLTPLFGVAIAYPVLWSLAVEEHFYFVWPLVVRKLKHRQVLVVCLGIILLSPLSRLVSYYLSLTKDFASFICNEYTWNSLDGLACGAFFALWLRSCDRTRREVIRAMIVVALVAISLVAVCLPYGLWTRQTPVGAALQVVPAQFLFICVLGAFLLLGTSRWKSFVQSKTLRFFGEISYGLYLYHLLVFDGVDFLAKRLSLSCIPTQSVQGLFSRFLLASSGAVILAFVSRRTLESRFLALKKTLTRE